MRRMPYLELLTGSSSGQRIVFIMLRSEVLVFIFGNILFITYPTFHGTEYLCVCVYVCVW